MPVDMGSVVLERLRRQTRDLQKKVEGAPLYRSMSEGKATQESYGLLLQRMWAFHQSFEGQVRRRREWSDFGFDLDARLKLTAIERDLAFLGMGVDRSLSLELPLKGASFEKVCGYLYATEVMTLGGQMMVKMMARKLGIGPVAGGEYLYSYGDRVTRMWRDCQDFFDRVGESRGSAGIDMAEGAMEAFGLLDGWLRK
jgi:heme oxygenase